MKRAVIIVAYEDQYQGLHGIYDVRVLETDKDDLLEMEETAQEACEEVIDSYSCCEESDGEYIIYRQRDESPLTLEEVKEIVNDYGKDVEDSEDFNKHFEIWE